MNSILPKVWPLPLRQLLPLGFFLVFSLISASCAYRFSNLTMRPPVGVRTIAIEAVYDTSREVIPHELLWSAVQKEFVRSGRLQVTPQSQADAIVTIWLNKARVSPTGTPSREAFSKDPVVTDDNKGRPEDFRNLRRAGSWTTSELVSMGIEVEVHDLKTRKLLFKRTYEQAAGFNSLRPENITSASSAFLHYEEALRAKVKQLSEQMAQLIVADFLATGA